MNKYNDVTAKVFSDAAFRRHARKKVRLLFGNGPGTLYSSPPCTGHKGSGSGFRLCTGQVLLPSATPSSGSGH
jgi:hypothetical protein